MSCSKRVAANYFLWCLAAISFPFSLAAQSPPQPDASKEAVLEYYVQSYGAPARLQNLGSFQIKWDSRNRASRESSRYQGRSLIGASAISWTRDMWSYRSWMGPEKRDAIGLVDDGEHMFITGLEGSNRLGPPARHANQLHRFVNQGAVPIGEWTEISDDFDLAGPAEVDGKSVWKLHAYIRLDHWVLDIDQETGLAFRMEYYSRNSEHDDEREHYRFTLLDHREIEGIFVPHRVEVETNFYRPTEWTLAEASFDEPVDEDAFDIPPPRR